MKFNFRLLTHSPDELNVQSAKLGDPSNIKELTDKDIGKPMVMGNAGNFDFAGDGDAFDGFLDNIDGGGTTDKMSFGGVARGQIGVRFKAQVSGSADVLDYVVAGANAAEATANSSGLGVVKKSVDGSSNPVATSWRIIAFLSDENSGTDEPAIIERV